MNRQRPPGTAPTPLAVTNDKSDYRPSTFIAFLVEELDATFILTPKRQLHKPDQPIVCPPREGRGDTVEGTGGGGGGGEVMPWLTASPARSPQTIRSQISYLTIRLAAKRGQERRVEII